MYDLKLSSKINSKKCVIGVVGLGYVGLPLVREFTKKKFKVIGIDKDKKKVLSLNNCKSYIKSISSSEIEEFFKNKFEASFKIESIKRCDVVIYCLPTPLDKNKGPDMSYINDTLEKGSKYLKKGQLLILESTTYPGTTEEYFLPVLKQRNFKVGKNIFLGYSPEREDPGNKNYSIDKISKVISGFTPRCKRLVKALYKCVVKETIEVSSIRSAEMTKLLENIYRCVNIGLVNELKLVCERMSMDIFEIINAAKSKPFGFQAFYPGPGLGGHCIPIDPYILSWKAKEYGIDTKFIELAGQINESMPEYVLKNLQDALGQQNKTLYNSNICILGVAYKKNVDDIRESPALKIIKLLEKKRVKISFSDPYVNRLLKSRNYNFNYKSIKLTKKKISDFDAILLITDHDSFDYELIKKNSQLIIDTRGKFKPDNKKIFRS